MNTHASWLDRYSDALMRYPKRILLAVLVLVVVLASQLPTLVLDTNLEHFISAENPARQAYDRVKTIYGRNDVIVVGISADDVLAESTLTELADLHRHIEQDVPWVKRVNSLINAPYQEGRGDSLLVDDLVPQPVGTLSRSEIEARLAQMPTLEGMVINADRSFTTLVIEPFTYDFDPKAVAQDNDAFGDAFGDDFMADTSAAEVDASSDTFLPIEKTNELIDALQQQLAASNLHSVVAGMPVVNQQLEQTMKTEMLTFIRLTVALIVVVLVLFFRRVSAVVAPMLAVGLAIVITFSLLALSGQKVQMPLILVPSFLLAIAVGDSVHLLTHFFNRYNAGEARSDAMRHAISVTALPILLTSLTTAAGLATLASGDLIPIANLGIFSAIGVMLALLLTLVVLPTLIALWPLAAPKAAKHSAQQEQLLQRLSNLNWRFGALFAGLWLVVVAIALIGVLQLRFSFNPLNWMPASSAIRQATETVDSRLSGTINMDVVITTGRDNGIKNPQLLQALDKALNDLQAGAPGGVRIGHVNSLIDIVKGTNQALNEGDSAFYRLPDDAGLLAEELLLFENSGADELSRLVDSSFSETKVTLIMPWQDILAYQDFIEVIDQRLGTAVEPWADVSVTGLLPLLSEALNAVIQTTAWSYALAALVIAIMLMLLLRSVGLGLIAMLPNLAPIVVVMGLMHHVGIPLDLFTMLVATIAIGITVDNTVHFAHHFRRALFEQRDTRRATDIAFQNAGKALLTTAVVLTAGFYVFLFSDVSSIFNFGFLSGTAFLLALLSNFTLTPVLLRWYAPVLLRHFSSQQEH
ncbi:MMPL family transporter [Saccharospirillum sp. HFRX-1]|uniref:efflux RND transporter permease subunit n=1 Tax=unclassified Saccharospirillum TaxID=2633430 RepID=UPI0037245F2A